MNTELIQRLANPVYDVEEAQELMRIAGLEIVRLSERIAYLNDCIYKLRDENDRLALDLGIRDNPQLSNRH
jgi:predicted nuclease with TOPRIM domain